MNWLKKIFLALPFIFVPVAFADMTVAMYGYDANGNERNIGTIEIEQSKYGVLFVPNLHYLPPGIHGFHVHDHSSCADHFMAAGGHLDPEHTNRHLGPYDHLGHLGDLPVLYVDKDGNSTLPVLAPRLRLTDLPGHALMIHAGGDNYSDYPQELGGGGPRIACGIIK